MWFRWGAQEPMSCYRIIIKVIFFCHDILWITLSSAKKKIESELNFNKKTSSHGKISRTSPLISDCDFEGRYGVSEKSLNIDYRLETLTIYSAELIFYINHYLLITFYIWLIYKWYSIYRIVFSHINLYMRKMKMWYFNH